MTAISNKTAQPQQSPEHVQSGFWTTVRDNLVYLAWLQALLATGGSLYFSEVMKFVPCALCWYQRILMYPLVLVILVGILLRDQRLRLYVLPMSLLGLGISIYHNLLQYQLIAEAANTPCTVGAGASCTTLWINWFGFVTIPLLSLIAFSVITLCMIFYKREELPDYEIVDEGTDE
jgi:disulfide bond formation protein DsbB